MRWALLAVILLGCSQPLPPRFVAERAAAESAYARGDYRGSAAGWRRAADVAPNAREREEAMYREAASLERAGDRAAAERSYEQLEQGHGERAERAAYARAESVLARGDDATGYALLRAALIRFPGSGLARNAARRLLEAKRAQGGSAAALAELDALLQRVRGSELEETLTYTRAQWLEAAGQTAAARSAYLEQAARFPYPQGVYWDDALLAVARIDEASGHAEDALAHLQRLLRERETAHLSGSYERSSYAEARFHIAVIYRDRLHDPVRARAEFRRVWTDHPTSRLRDDALFQEALVALRSNDSSAACEPARLLLTREPDSRFSQCANALCPSLSSVAGGCRSYLNAQIAAAREPERGEEPHSSSSR